jgi:TlyA family rRNA methyltransferase/putative hemolysin
MRKRTDRLLVERGLAPSREKAQALVMAGLVSSGGRAVLKAGELVDETADLLVQKPLPYVGRGGLKLEEALDRFGIDVGGAVALDVGSSTGGFTDCLLQRGAGKVYAVDVDTKQLDWALRRDPRVVLVEKNARHLAAEDIGEAPGVVTLDLSFISLLKVLPALREIPGDWVLLDPDQASVRGRAQAGREKGGCPGPRRPRGRLGPGRRGGPGARLRARGALRVLDPRPEREPRVLRPVGQGKTGPQPGPHSVMDQGGGEP